MLFYYQGMRPVDRAGRIMLYGAGAFNFIAAGVVEAIVRLAPGWIGLVPPVPSQMLFIDLVIGMILVFGFAYALAARDLTRYWPCVALGLAGKTVFVSLIFAYFAVGRIGFLLALLVSADLVFAILFHQLLNRHAISEEYSHV